MAYWEKSLRTVTIRVFNSEERHLHDVNGGTTKNYTMLITIRD